MSVLDTAPKKQMKELTAMLEEMADGNHKTTAIKLELEAHLNRTDSESEECYECEGSGYSYCDSCDEGNVDHEHNEICAEDCDDRYDTCSDCAGDYRQECSRCEGNGRQYGNSDYESEETCEAFIANRVPQEVREATTFMKFYNDGSVDSECTVTMPIKHAAWLVYYIEAWNDLAKEIGNGMNVDKAGMHISVLNDPNCYYEPGDDENSLNRRWAQNFANALNPLLPALYFLASPNGNSRSTGYRMPLIGSSKHNPYYPAVCTHDNTSIEYRIFDTCYDDPLKLLDNIIVIGRTLRFYKEEPTDTLKGIGDIGLPDGDGLNRFFFTVKHLEALDKGLVWLKPNYKSIATLKKERKFEVNRRSLARDFRKMKDQWRADYHKERVNIQYRVRRQYHRYMADAWEQVTYGTIDKKNISAYAREKTKEWAKENYRGSNIKDYIDSMSKQHSGRGYTITI